LVFAKDARQPLRGVCRRQLAQARRKPRYYRINQRFREAVVEIVREHCFCIIWDA
jgi:hypothetical protein